MSRLARLRKPVLCYVTDRRSLASLPPAAQGDVLLSKIEDAANAGVDWIQLREKDLFGKDCAALTREALRRTAQSSKGKKSSTRIFLNDRLDVAFAEYAAGVHLGENSLPVADAKRLVQQFSKSAATKEDFLIGASCHSLESAEASQRDGADYILFGPVFATPSKASFGAPQGIERLAKVCEALAIPVLAIGGVTMENAAMCLTAGASGIAAIRLFQDAPDMRGVVDVLRQLRV
jgi:thiamine-phosphate pyrophosphorylase